MLNIYSKHIALGVLFCVCLSANCFAESAPLLSAKFLSDSEIEAINRSISITKKTTLKNTYQLLIKDADRYLFKVHPSVINNGGNQNPHLYFTESPYCGWSTFWGLWGDSCRDGHINPDADREDYKQAIRMGKESVTLALAYRLTNNAVYADKVSTYIDAWVLDEKTRITPQFTNSQSHIELCITHLSIFYAINLMWDHANWDAAKKTRILMWIREWGKSIEHWREDNNFEDWRIAMRLSIYSMTGDEAGMARAVNDFKNRINSVISDQGKMIHELRRTKSLSYSLYAINAMMQSAEIAWRSGIDLYQYRDDRGVGLETALDLHQPFLLKPNKNSWPYQQISPIKKSDVAIFELAVKRYEKASYAKIVQIWGRPLIEIRVLQHISLTHGADSVFQ